MARHKFADSVWEIRANSDGTIPEKDAHLAVLMDIRDELQKLNLLLHCQNFTQIPHVLQKIDLRLSKRIKLK